MALLKKGDWIMQGRRRGEVSVIGLDGGLGLVGVLFDGELVFMDGRELVHDWSLIQPAGRVR